MVNKIAIYFRFVHDLGLVGKLVENSLPIGTTLQAKR